MKKSPAALAVLGLAVLALAGGCSAPEPAPSALPSLAPAGFATGRITPTVSATPTSSPTAENLTSPLPDTFRDWTAYKKTAEPNAVLVFYAKGPDRKQTFSAGFIATAKGPEALRDGMTNPETIAGALCADTDKPTLFVCATQAEGGVVITSGSNLTKAEVADIGTGLAKLVRP